MPLVKEATALAQELCRSYAYGLRLHVQPLLGSGTLVGSKTRLVEMVLMCVCKSGAGETLFEWTMDTLENRV